MKFFYLLVISLMLIFSTSTIFASVNLNYQIELYSDNESDNTDGDEFNNNQDLDDDNDGITDIEEVINCQDTKTDEIDVPVFVPSPGCYRRFSNIINKAEDKCVLKYCKDVDSDGDGTPDRLDLDSDGDGIYDIVEAGGIDQDNDGYYGNEVMDKCYKDKDNHYEYWGNGLDNRLEDLGTHKCYDREGNLITIEKVVLPFPDSDGDGKRDFQDADDDNDGVLTKFEVSKNATNNAVSTIDTDNDGTPNHLDIDDDGDGYLTKDEHPDKNKDGNPDDARDSNEDNVPDYLDGDADHDNFSDNQDLDDDDDGIADMEEVTNCKDEKFEGSMIIYDPIPDSNAKQCSQDDDCGNKLCKNYRCIGVKYCEDIDTDSDGIPDRLDIDSDNDGIYDVIEGGGVDEDHDGRYNTGDKKDNNRNGMDDRVEEGLVYGEDSEANHLIGKKLSLPDSDGDGKRDFQDEDDDNDGVLTKFETTKNPTNNAAVPMDTDNDGTPNHLDIDDDGDGFLTKDEHPDDNKDGNPDDALDSDGDKVPDYLDGNFDNDYFDDNDDLDDDDDGIADIEEVTNCKDNKFDGAVIIYDPENCDRIDPNASCDPKYCEDVDSDSDGMPDRLDLDSDNDGLFDTIEGEGVDQDHDGKYDKEKVDNNRNGMDDRVEEGNKYYDENQKEKTGKKLPLTDHDKDGKRDFQDDDDDDDKILTKNEHPDDNKNGAPDDALDSDGDGTPDYLDPGILEKFTSGNSMFSCAYANNISNIMYIIFFMLLALFLRNSIKEK